MKIPTLIILAASALLPLQSLPALELAPKKATEKKATKKKPASSKKTAPKKTTKPKKATPKKATTPKKASTPKKPAVATKKKVTPKETTAPKKPTTATKKPATTTKKTGSHLSMASPELKKKAAAMVKSLPAAKKSKLLALLNKGKVEDFKEFPGVGPAKFANMKKGRPFKTVEDLANISGFGEATFKAVVGHAKKMK